MPDINAFRNIALSLPGTSEEPHFEKTSFRVGKKIFATFDPVSNLACVKLSEIDQDVFMAFDRNIIYPVPNKWGKQGWTMVDLEKVPHDMFTDILVSGYCRTAPKKLGEFVRPSQY